MKKTTLTLTFALALSLPWTPSLQADNNPSPAASANPPATPASSATPDVDVPAPEGLTEKSKSIWEQDYLTGNWGGFRDQLADKGLSLTPVYQGEVMGNPSGGVRQGVIYDAVLNTTLDLDLEKTTGWWTDGKLHANALYIHGPSLSGEDVGDFSNTSNISGYNSLRLQELWFEQGFWQKRASVRIGMMAADAEFFASSSAALFLNGTFGAFTLLGSNVPNAPIYPVASPGIRLMVQPTSTFYAMSGVYAMDNNSDSAGNNENGTHFHIDGPSGLLVMSEIGYLLNQSPNDRGLQGTYRLGSFVHTANYTTWDSQAQSALGTGNLVSAGTNYGIYGVLDQQIYSGDGKAISFFVRSGTARSSVDFVDYYAEGGFNFTGFIPGRDNDVAGVGVARSHVSSEFSDSQVLQGNAPYSAETVLEATYKVVLAPWWSVQPDFQYIFNPSGEKGSTDAVVLGCRTTIAF